MVLFLWKSLIIFHTMSRLKELEVNLEEFKLYLLGKKSAGIEIVKKYLSCSRTCKPLSTIMYEALI